jgi:hypothetical protein
MTRISGYRAKKVLRVVWPERASPVAARVKSMGPLFLWPPRAPLARSSQRRRRVCNAGQGSGRCSLAGQFRGGKGYRRALGVRGPVLTQRVPSRRTDHSSASPGCMPRASRMAFGIVVAQLSLSVDVCAITAG